MTDTQADSCIPLNSQDHPADRTDGTQRCMAQEFDRRCSQVRLAPLRGELVSTTDLASLRSSWTSKTGSGPAGDVEIHAYLGETLYKGESSGLIQAETRLT